MHEKLRLSNEKMLQILSLSPLATAIYTGPEITIQSVNEAMLAIWGKDKSVVGKTFEQAIPEIIGQPFPELLKTVWNTGESYEDTDARADLIIEGRLQTFYFDYKYEAVKNEVGDIESILHTATDVTERLLNRNKLEEHQERATKEQAATQEQASINEQLLAAQSRLLDINEDLNASKNRLRLLIEQIPTAINVFKTHDLIVDLPNERMLEIWGRTEAEVIDKPLLVALPELIGQPFLKKLEEGLNTGNAYYSSDEKALINRKGKIEECYFNIVYQPIVDSDGSITSILQTCTEVTKEVLATRQVINLNKELIAINTELLNTNLELQLSQDSYVAVYRELLKSEQDLLFIIDAAGLATFDLDPIIGTFSGNDLLKAWFGLTPDEQIPLHQATDSIAENDRERVTKAIEEALQFRSGGKYDMEYNIINPNNPIPRTVRAKGKTLFNDQQQPIRLSGTLQDITEQKKDEQRKNDFINMVSHELKTPITSLNGYIQLLQRKALKTEDNFSISSLDKAKKQVDKMTTMINGFLNVSRLESSQIQIDKQLFDMAQLVKETEEESIASITSHQVVFAPVEYTLVNADQDKIGYVINNLISNAVKYSPNHSTINVACITQDGYAVVSIKDEGMGIAQQDIDKLFDRFYRVQGDHMQTIAGFGIGLYLCKEIIDRHQGKIWVESELGKGSTFYFSLPVHL